MDFVDTVKLLVRRWFVFLGILIPLGAGSFLYVKQTPPKYKATANVAFTGPAVTPPKSATTVAPTNPLTPTDLSLIVHDYLTSARTVLTIQGKGDAGYAVEDPTNNPSPLMSITATSTNSAAALKTVNDLLALARTEVSTSQSGINVDPKAWDQMVLVTGPGPVTRQSAGKVRAAAALGILALIVALAATFIADNILTRRKERRRARVAAEEAEKSEVDTDGTASPVWVIGARNGTTDSASDVRR
jgi:hypothetical protein